MTLFRLTLFRLTLWLLALCLLCAENIWAAGNNAPVRFSYIETSQSKGAQEAMVVKGGSWWSRRHLTHGAVLIEHPQGTLLYDTGLGTKVDEQYAVNSWLTKQLFAYTQPHPVVTQLQENHYPVENIDAIIPSHLHWDHASGLVDFPGTPVWVQQRELEAARAGEKPSFLDSQLSSDTINWHFIELTNTPFLGFSNSLDIYGDGSVVLVNLSGHTAAQVGLYLKLSEDRQYLFIGDTTWTLEGVINNKPRPGMLKLVVDLEDNQTLAEERIAQVHKLYESRPQLAIVPAHDERVAATLPHFPVFSSTMN
ncbi:MBL fold metallo-hydrolase [Hahella sp. CCB-MM4]|uniref:MBL fold metallo-hydrolase n=1 Tax=Hahella sp. (strain CCB-MM4) TaxID=1926491 RepID=UPI000B9BD6E4|nr:MBL fold metallo-hydrolase [Hahella sp. CCB-MM4]OZG74541.1 MBL fold metallo-hydrolase [Hahella sp. CCB-MM4]